MSYTALAKNLEKSENLNTVSVDRELSRNQISQYAAWNK